MLRLCLRRTKVCSFTPLSTGKKSYFSPAAQVLKRLFLKRIDEKRCTVEAKLGLLTPLGHLTREVTVSVFIRSTEKTVI